MTLIGPLSRKQAQTKGGPMTSRSVHRTHGPNDARGIILVVVLLVVSLLSLLGAALLTMSSTEHTIASNENNMARAFNIAEAGLERAKTRIKTGTEANVNSFLLSVNNPGPNPFGSAPGAGNAFDGGNYIVVIQDDVDANPSLDVDTNNRVFIRSTGTYRTAQKQILALVEKSPLVPVPTPRGAGETYSNGETELHGKPGGSFDGRDWNAPTPISGVTCPTNACGTVTANPPTHGAFTNSNVNPGNFELTAGGTMFGTGCLPPSPCTNPATASNGVDTSLPLTRWDSTIAALVPLADRTLTLNGAWSGTHTWGTPAAPEITVINNSSMLNWTSVVTGAGVLIIESTGNSGFTVQGSGELNWQGLVIVRSSGFFNILTSGGSSKLRVFGQMVNVSTTQSEIEFQNANSFVKYSSAGMGLVQTAAGGGGGFMVRSWQEVAL